MSTKSKTLLHILFTLFLHWGTQIKKIKKIDKKFWFFFEGDRERERRQNLSGVTEEEAVEREEGERRWRKQQQRSKCCLSRRDEVKKMTEKINIYFWKIKRVEHRNKEYDLLLLSTSVFTFIFDFATVLALVYGLIISTLNVFYVFLSFLDSSLNESMECFYCFVLL